MRRPPARRWIPRSAARSMPQGLHLLQSMSSAWDWLGSIDQMTASFSLDGPTTRWARRLVMVNDGDLVVAAGTPEGWGVGVIAGTGSIAVGRTKDERTARAGGWGHLIGDEGSAYGVVLDALRLVARRADGRDAQPPGRDPLTERICAAFGVAKPSQIVTTIYSPDFTRTESPRLHPRFWRRVPRPPRQAGNC